MAGKVPRDMAEPPRPSPVSTAMTEPGLQDTPVALARDRDACFRDRGIGRHGRRDDPNQDLEELAEARAYKHVMLDDAASATSLQTGGGTGKSRAAQMRVLETALSRATAQRDLMRRVALAAEGRQHAEEDKAAELEERSKVADEALAALEVWMDSQLLSRKAQPPHKQKQLAELTRQAQVARAAGLVQRAAAEREREVYLHAKREADRAEREYHAGAEIREELSTERIEEEASRVEEAMKKVSIEASVAAKMEAHHKARAEEREQNHRELQEKAKAQLKAAKAAREAAAERANKLVRDAEPALKEVVCMREEAHAQRVEAILQLKADTEAAAALIRGKNERRAGERAMEDAEHEAEREQLAARGLNPYKVFKQRDVDRRAAKEEKRQERAIRRRKVELAQRLHKEDLLRQKKDEHDRVDREHEQRFRKELGKHVTDARNRQYLRSKTVDGTDVLDPSGRSFRVEPSQVTTIKDAAFGLGYHPRKNQDMAAAMVDLVASKPQHAGLGPGEFSRLVPRDSRPEASNSEGAPAENIGEYPGAESAPLPGPEGSSQILEELVPPARKEILPGKGIRFVEDSNRVADDDGDKGGDGVGGLGQGGRDLSMFERRALERARLRQKERLDAGEPQVAAGRTFQDKPAFVSKPDRIIFKDFIVGKVHRRRVILTNVSLTFNTFKVLEMADEITRFFQVTYSRPGRLSAGMTCAVDIAFTPKLDEDIFTELPIRTQTGPLSILVVCTARRVKPSLSTNQVVFRGTVTGEKETVRVVITNDGAIPTSFTIEDVESYPPPTQPRSSKASRYSLPADSVVHQPVEDDDGQTAPAPLFSKVAGGKGQAGIVEELRGSVGSLHDTEITPEIEPSDRKGAENPPLPVTEEMLLARAMAVGDAALRYPEGRTVIVVETAGGKGLKEGGGASGRVAAYESAEILVTFAPLSVGDFRAVKAIRFTGCTQKSELVVEASSAPVAVFPAEVSTDLRCCVVGKLYIKKIRICNRGKIAMKAIARVPSALRDCATFSPDMGFVQPGLYFDFNLRFRPDEQCLAQCISDGWGIRLPTEEDSSRSFSVAAAAPIATILDHVEPDDHTGNGRNLEEIGGGIIAVPVRVDVPLQALPARFTLQARVTGWKVDIACDEGCDGLKRGRGRANGSSDGGSGTVRFGSCFVGQSVTKRMSLTNTSQLPVKFGFVGNPIEVTVQPCDGFGALRPGEQRWVEATYSPVSAVVHHSQLTFRTTMGQNTSLRCRGRGVEPVVTLSHTVINMASACPGDTVTTSVFARNVSSGEQQLEFTAPEPSLSFLKICPSVVHLTPGGGSRIEIQFCPLHPSRSNDGNTHPRGKGDPLVTTDVARYSANGTAEPGASADGVAGDSPAENTGGNAGDLAKTSVESEGKTGERGGAGDRDLSNVPLYTGVVEEGGTTEPLKWPGTGDALGAQDGRADLKAENRDWGDWEVEPWSQHGRWKVPCFVKPVEDAGIFGGRAEGTELPPLALEVTTVMVSRVLSVDKNQVDFGQLAIGSKAEATLRVRNASDDDLPLEGGGLNAVGPFQVLNAFRPMRAHGGTHRCLLQFRPERAGLVSETLVLSSPLIGKSIHVRLRGEGVNPTLRMEPSDGRLDMGYVLEGDTVHRNMTLHNESVFRMQYTTTPFGPRPPDNYNRMEVFGLTPCQGWVPPGESVTVKASFSPDHCRIWKFLTAFQIKGRDQPDGGHVLRVRGRCVSRQVYVEAMSPGLNPWEQVPEATEDALAPCLPGESGSALSTEAEVASGVKLDASPIPPILLRFPKDSEGTVADGNGDRDKSAPPVNIAISVGCLNTNDPKKSSTASFEIEFSPDAIQKGYFKATPDKGSVAPGGTSEIVFAFEPPTPPPRTPGPAGGKGGAPEVGQWYKTVAIVHIRGGYRPPGSAEILPVKVQLEGFVTA